jgi:lysozyme
MIPLKALEIIEEFEGFSSRVYWDSYGRVYTRGFGETEGIHADSPPISRERAQANLKNLLEDRYYYAIKDIGKDFNENEISSILSTLWNLGAGIIAQGTELGDFLREGKFTHYANALLNYDHAGGVVLPGLRTRREEERKLFLTPMSITNPLDVLYPEELEFVDQYLGTDIAHHPIEKKKLYKKLVFFRKSIWEAAEHGHFRDKGRWIDTDKGWNINNRRSRYNLLRKITKKVL